MITPEHQQKIDQVAVFLYESINPGDIVSWEDLSSDSQGTYRKGAQEILTQHNWNEADALSAIQKTCETPIHLT